MPWKLSPAPPQGRQEISETNQVLPREVPYHWGEPGREVLPESPFSPLPAHQAPLLYPDSPRFSCLLPGPACQEQTVLPAILCSKACLVGAPGGRMAPEESVTRRPIPSLDATLHPGGMRATGRQGEKLEPAGGTTLRTAPRRCHGPDQARASARQGQEGVRQGATSGGLLERGTHRWHQELICWGQAA